MMKKLSLTNRLALLALSGAVWLLPQMAWPQSAAETDMGRDSRRREEPRIDFVIKGGQLELGDETKQATVGNLIQHLKDRISDVDFVLSPGVAEIVISNLTLRSAGLRSTVEAISFATGNKVRVGSLGGGNFYALTLAQPAQPEKSLEVFNLSPILGAAGLRDSEAVGKHMAEISSLILSTIKSFDERTQQQRGTPLLNFNESTGLLVIIAHPTQLEIASKIVKALNEPLRPAARGRLGNVPPTPQAEGSADPRPTTP